MELLHYKCSDFEQEVIMTDTNDLTYAEVIELIMTIVISGTFDNSCSFKWATKKQRNDEVGRIPDVCWWRIQVIGAVNLGEIYSYSGFNKI